MKADKVRAVTAVIAPTTAKSLRTRGLATIRLMPATRIPTINAARAVLVWVRIRMTPDTTTTSAVVRPRRLPQNQSTTTSPIMTAA